jgi:hypothetical protein
MTHHKFEPAPLRTQFKLNNWTWGLPMLVIFLVSIGIYKQQFINLSNKVEVQSEELKEIQQSQNEQNLSLQEIRTVLRMNTDLIDSRVKGVSTNSASMKGVNTK